ncbi:MAG: SOS response-associated peptidase family protein, partial [Alphaproteobacteria bacterium]
MRFTLPSHRDAKERELALLRWGLVPPWSEGPDSGYGMINARAATVATRPFFGAAFLYRRCPGQDAPSAREMTIGRGFPPPNQLDKRRIATYLAGLGPDLRWDALRAPIVGNRSEPSGESRLIPQVHPPAGYMAEEPPPVGGESSVSCR